MTWLTSTRRKLLLDIAERSFWTGIQVAVALITTQVTDIPEAWAVPVGIILAGLKGMAASKVGRPDSASTLPD